MNLRKIKSLIGFLAVLIWLPLNVEATPSAQVVYVESDLGGGVWGYNYTLYNTSDPVADTEFDLYYFTLFFDPPVSLSTNLPPENWDFISDFSTFIDWFSTLPGEPPIGVDIAPGSSLSGFNLTSDARLVPLRFEAMITNPVDPDNPVLFCGNLTPASDPIPEPATVILLSSGLAGVGFFRRKSFFNPRGHSTSSQ